MAFFERWRALGGEMASVPEGEPTFRVAAHTITGDETVVAGVRASDSVVELTLAAAEAGGMLPEQVRLALESGEALDDAARTLESHGIVKEARLQLTVRTAEEVERRGGGSAWLRAAFTAEATRRYRAALSQLHCPTRLMLCNADGSEKHMRWFWLRIGDDGLPQLLWGKNEDGSNHIRWKSLNCSAPRKVRTVTGGREEAIEIRQGGHRSSRSAPRASPTASSHRFTAITTVDGHVVRVRTPSSYDGCYTKDVPAHLVGGQGDAWLAALRQIGTTRRWCGAGLPDATVQSLAAAGCRSVLDVSRRVLSGPFPFQDEPFGTTGVLHAIGTKGGTQPWANPCTDPDLPHAKPRPKTQADASAMTLWSGDLRRSEPFGEGGVTVRWSSRGRAPVQPAGLDHELGAHEAGFVSRPPEEPGECATENKEGSWMAVDLGAGRRLAIEHYALRNDGSGIHALRTWELEGADSLDASEWTTLRAHMFGWGDDTLQHRTAYAEGAWPVQGGGRAFRCFRVRQTGPNASGYDHTLSCGGIELYGTLEPSAEA